MCKLIDLLGGNRADREWSPKICPKIFTGNVIWVYFRSIRRQHPGKEPTVAGKFEIYEDKAGKFRFRLKAGNGEVVATGQGYESLASVKKGVSAVQRAADGATVNELEKED